jgi:large subunit ribosomal protein L18
MNELERKNQKREKRKKRVRKKILFLAREKGLPRLCVFRSNKYLYAQIIDDRVGRTLLALDEKTFLKERGKEKIQNIEEELGKALAQKAREKGLKKVIFDRGGYSYHGRIKSFAEGARKGGLQF